MEVVVDEEFGVVKDVTVLGLGIVARELEDGIPVLIGWGLEAELAGLEDGVESQEQEQHYELEVVAQGQLVGVHLLEQGLHLATEVVEEGVPLDFRPDLAQIGNGTFKAREG